MTRGERRVKKGHVLAAISVLLLSFALVGCSASSDNKNTTVEVTSNGLTISVPSEWDVKDADRGKYVYPDCGGLLYLMTNGEMDNTSTSCAEYYEKFMQGTKEATPVSEPSEVSVGDAKAIRTEVDFEANDDIQHGYIEVIFSGFDVYSVVFIMPKDAYEENADSMLDILNGISLDSPQGPTFHASSNPKEQGAAETKAEQATASQQNALRMALSYLDYSAFSYTGLVEQLEYEGFSNEDAVYGAENCGADWNEQAALKTAAYLDYSAFSRDGLIEQLLYEGFTEEQAEYGVSAVGL